MLTIVELKDKLKRYGIKGYSKMNKEQLLQKVLEYEDLTDLIKTGAASIDKTDEAVIAKIKSHGATDVIQPEEGCYIGVDQHGMLMGLGIIGSRLDLMIVNNRFLGRVEK